MTERRGRAEKRVGKRIVGQKDTKLAKGDALREKHRKVRSEKENVLCTAAPKRNPGGQGGGGGTTFLVYHGKNQGDGKVGKKSFGKEKERERANRVGLLGGKKGGP